MRIAFIVQRYGLDIAGGAELLCRLVAEHLSKYYDVEVLTTCARDHLTWRNEYPEGEEAINGVLVRRFNVATERDVESFSQFTYRIFHEPHTRREELKWLKLQGPYCPALLGFLAKHETRYDLLIFFSYRYWLSYHGVMHFPNKTLLVPTAEHEPTIYLKIFAPLFHKPKAIGYLSVEEKELINRVSSNHGVPGGIVGVGISPPDCHDPDEFRVHYNLHDDYVIYIGRIDPNKGCHEMFEYFMKYCAAHPASRVRLVLIGKEAIPIPTHTNIIHLGFVSEEDKFGALEASRFMVMPSPFESLSIVTLEAWALSKPALVNGQCEVLKGQCLRSNGGLYYDDYTEFDACMDYLLQNVAVTRQLGRQGKSYVEANYSWEVVEKKYIELIREAAS